MLPPRCMFDKLRRRAFSKVLRHVGSAQPATHHRVISSTALPCSKPMVAEMLSNVENPLAGMAVNFHFTRKCNMSCKFCFHTAKSSDVMDTKDALKLITDLREAGASKLNFAGGEPFLPGYQPLLAAMARHAREVGFLSVSVITNGSMLKRQWFADHGRHLTMLGLSCDSIDPATNVAIGRVRAGSSNGADQAKHVRNAAALCREFGIDFKLNTVVCAANAREDMTPLIIELWPTLTRWKLFQVLPLAGENTGREGELRDVRPLLVSDDVFDAYVARARAGLRAAAQTAAAPAALADTAGSAAASPPTSPLEDILKVEGNATMQSSYILVDEHGRFLDSSTGGKTPTESIRKVGVCEALRQLRASPGGGFDAEAFVKRDGAFYLR